MLTFSQAPYSFKDERNNLPTVFPGHCSFSFEQAEKLLKFVDPITLPFTGVKGNIVQLWQHKNSLIGSVSQNGKVKILFGERIFNGLRRNEKGFSVLNRLRSSGLRKWQLAYIPEKERIEVWPYLIASGRDDLSSTQKKINNIKGHLTFRDLSAAWKENKGEVVARKKDGTPWDHVDEAGNAQRGLKNIIQRLKQELARPLSPEARAQKQNELSQASKLLDHSEGFLKSSPHKRPSEKQFQQTLQQTKLTDSYNGTHRGNPVPAKGGTGGDIGGVASGAEYIEGLFDSPESLLEHEHYFALPRLEDGQAPFSNDELRQILRELAIGIYTHSTVPFFSLHFRQGKSADLFPVIHPAYENTLVGRVISMLDYWMKGYLNGGIFSEDFVEGWHQDPDWGRRGDSALKELISLEEYCQKHLSGNDKNYKSARSLEYQFNHDPLLKLLGGKVHQTLTGDSATLSQFDGFRNSFRILSKQKSFQKEGDVFFIDSDFEVKYTIAPSPAYKKEFEKHLRTKGYVPDSHQAMITIYELMAQRIHDHMVKLPFCRKYFAMLGVINFFSSYFSTMKRHRRVPLLPLCKPVTSKGCPPLFPHLPLTNFSKETLKMNLKEVYTDFLSKNRYGLKSYLKGLSSFLLHNPTKNPDSYDRGKVETLKKAFAETLEDNILSHCSPPFRRVVQENCGESIKKIAEKNANQAIDTQVEIISKNTLDNRRALLAGEGKIKFGQTIDGIRDSLPSTCNVLNNPENPEEDVSLTYKTDFLPSELPEKELERNKRIVGGCGMILEAHKLRPSFTASEIQQANMMQLLSMDTESWQKVAITPDTEGWVFRLEHETVPPWEPDGYSWMEEALLTSSPENPIEENQQRISILIAMSKGEKDKFSEFVDGIDDLKTLKNRSGATLLHEAAKIDDPFFFDKLRSKGLSPGEKDNFGFLPIHYAAMEGCCKTLKRILVINSACLNEKSRNDSTPLVIAIQYGQEEAVRVLLSNKPKPTLLANGYSDLHCALHEGNRDVIQAILENHSIISPAINICCEEGGTPLMLACELDDADLVSQLVGKGADPSAKRKDGITAIEIATRRQCVPVLRKLLEKTSPSELAIEAAARDGTVEIIKCLENESQFKNFQTSCKDTPLHIALRHANISVAEYLTKYTQWHDKKNVEKYSPFQLAIFIGAWDIAKALYERSCDVDYEAMLRTDYHPLLKEFFSKATFNSKRIQELLLVAAQAGNYLAISQVLQPLGAKLATLCGPKGWRLPHYLAKSDGIFLLKKEMVGLKSVLLPLNEEGNKTLPYIAAEYRSVRVLRFLLEQMKEGKESLEKHFNDRHLFYAIVESGDLESVKIAIEIFGKEGLINAPLDKQNTRAAHLAAQIGLHEILKYLKELGADLNAADAKNQKPIDYAVRLGLPDSIKYLLKARVTIDAHTLYEAVASKTSTREKIQRYLFSTNPSQKILDAALFEAVQRHNEKAFDFLHLKGAAFTHATTEGWTPLLLASQTGQSRMVEIITQAPSDLRKYKGDNPLHLACKEKHIRCVELLLQKGYHPDEPNHVGHTPKQIAGKDPAILEILKKEPRRFLAEIKAFEEALFKDDKKALKESQKNLPLNQPIQIGTPNGTSCWGTPVLLLACFCKERSIRKYVPSNMELEKFPSIINRPDSKGNTLAHYYSNIPRIINIKFLNFNCKNHEGQRPVHLAAKNASFSDFQNLLDKLPPGEIHIPDDQGKTALFYAVEGEQEKNVKLLLMRGADLRHYDRNLFTPLLLACGKDFLPSVKTLLQFGADPNQAGTFGKVTPLILSITKQHSEITRLLLFHGAQLSQLTRKGEHAIHFAAQQGDVELLRYCHAREVPLDLEDNKKMTPRHIAAGLGHIPFLEALNALQPDFKDHADVPTPLTLTATSSNPDSLRWFLDKGANPEEKVKGLGGDTLSAAAYSPAARSMISVLDPYRLSRNPKSLLPAILNALRKDNPDALQALYRKGIPLSSDIVEGESGLHVASRCGALQCTAWLLQNGTDPLAENHAKQNPLELAAANDSAEQFQMLLEDAQPPLDQRYNGGKSLAHLATQSGKLKHLVVLMHQGYPIDEKDVHGFTPLDLAVQYRHPEVVRFLLACGEKRSTDAAPTTTSEIADLIQQSTGNKKDSEPGDTRLHFAVKSHCPLAVLVCSKLDNVDQTNAEKITPLHLATRMGQIQSIIYLLKAGADPNAKTKKGQTSLWFAEQIPDLLLRTRVVQLFKPSKIEQT